MTEDELIEEIRRAAGWGMSRHVARKILEVVAPEIKRRACSPAADVIDRAIKEQAGNDLGDNEEKMLDRLYAARGALNLPVRMDQVRPDTDPLRETF